MRKNSSVQVRLDVDLRRALTTQVRAAKGANTAITESAVLRMLLREALAVRCGRPLPVNEQGFLEGFMKGSSEAQRAFQTALHSAVSAKRSA